MSAFISTVGFPALMAMLGAVFDALDHPVARRASDALTQVRDAIEQGEISAEKIAEANRHAEKMAAMDIAHAQANLAEVNRSLRAEVASEDGYVRRMRPTFGYIMAISWAAQMLGIAYVIMFDTDKAGVVMAAMGHLSTIWAVGLSVLGIYVYRRSDDKRRANPHTGPQDVIFWNSRNP